MAEKKCPELLEAILGPKFGPGTDFFSSKIDFFSKKIFFRFFSIWVGRCKKFFYPIVRSGHSRLFGLTVWSFTVLTILVPQQKSPFYSTVPKFILKIAVLFTHWERPFHTWHRIRLLLQQGKGRKEGLNHRGRFWTWFWRARNLLQKEDGGRFWCRTDGIKKGRREVILFSLIMLNVPLIVQVYLWCVCVCVCVRVCLCSVHTMSMMGCSNLMTQISAWSCRGCAQTFLTARCAQ